MIKFWLRFKKKWKLYWTIIAQPCRLKGFLVLLFAMIHWLFVCAMGCVTFELIKKVWNIMLASQAYMKDRSVLQIHNSFWGQSKFIVAFEFFKVGISYIYLFSFYNTMVLFWTWSMLMFEIWRQNQRLANKENWR